MVRMFLLNSNTFVWDLTILLLLAGSLAIATGCFGWALRRRRNVAVRFVVGFIGLIGFLLFLTVGYGSFVEPQIIVTTRKSVELPIAEPLRIAVISDLHAGPFKHRAFVERSVAHVNRLLPDLVLLAGDYIFTPEADLGDLEPLGDLRASLGVYAILGNHDIGQYRDLLGERIQRKNRGDEIAAVLEALGIRVLRNTHDVISIGSDSLALAGIDDLWTGASDIEAALATIPEETPIILLSHNPSVILDERSRRASLIVSGHTHGGQVRLPILGPVGRIPTDLGQSYDQGLFRVDDDTTLAITRGIGESSARARLFAWPEVLLLEIGGGRERDLPMPARTRAPGET